MTANKNDSSALKAYKLLAEIPTISSASFLKNQKARNDIKTISLNLGTRDHVSEQKLQINKIFTIQVDKQSNSDPQILSITSPTPITNSTSTIVSSFYSPSGARQAILRERERAWPDKKGGKARVVEIWKGTKCESRLEVNDFHGIFTSDETFGSFSFNQQEDSILYSAEAHPPKSEQGNEAISQQSFDFVPPLGEKFGQRLRPSIFLLRFRGESKDFTPSLFQLKPPRESLYLGQAVFSPDGNAFLTGYDTIKDGRRLGIFLCTNRPASIYSVTLPPQDQKAEKVFETLKIAEKDFVKLSGDKISARSPRVFIDEKNKGSGHLVFVGNQEGGPHNDCAAIYGIELSSSSKPSASNVKELLPILKEPDQDGFAGAYLDQLPSKPFILNGKSEIELMFDTIVGSRRVPMLLNLSTKKYRALAPLLGSFSSQPAYENEIWSYKALSVSDDAWVVGTRSAPQKPPQLVITNVHGSDESDSRWKVLWRAEEDLETDQDGVELLSKLAKIKSSIISQIPGAAKLVQSIVIESNPSLKSIVFPHGGPHGNSLYEFSPSTAPFALNGYNFVIPNYSGSLGLGQDFAHSLSGKAGALDVEDCLASTKHLVKLGIADPNKLACIGGSHGGFLVSHLVGQYPDVFKTVAMRNPVIANGEMAATSDIRDWCFSEFAEPFDFSNPPVTFSADFVSRTQAASPITHVHKIKVPVLILLGLSDQRVPPQQARLLYHALKGQGKKVRMLAFENADHALETVQAEWNGFEASFKWFEESLN